MGLGELCESDFDCQARMRCYFHSGSNDGQCFCIKRAMFFGPNCSQIPIGVVVAQLMLVFFLQYCSDQSFRLLIAKYKSWRNELHVSSNFQSSQARRGPSLSLTSLFWTSAAYFLLSMNMCVLVSRMIMVRMEGTTAIELSLARRVAPVLLNLGVLCALLAMLVTALYWSENYLLLTSSPVQQNQPAKWLLRHRKIIFAFPIVYYLFWVTFYLTAQRNRVFLNLCLMLCGMLVVVFYGWGGFHLTHAFRHISEPSVPMNHHQAISQLKRATSLTLLKTFCAFTLASINLMTDSLSWLPGFVHFAIPTLFHIILASILNTFLKYAASIELLPVHQSGIWHWLKALRRRILCLCPCFPKERSASAVAAIEEFHEEERI